MPEERFFVGERRNQSKQEKTDGTITEKNLNPKLENIFSALTTMEGAKNNGDFFTRDQTPYLGRLTI